MSVARINPRPRTMFCWWCGHKLATQITRKGKVYYSAIFLDELGNAHAVHKCCKQTLNKQKPITAQPREIATPANDSEKGGAGE